MKYSMEEALCEVVQRSIPIRKKRSIRQMRGLEGAGIGLLGLIVTTFAGFGKVARQSITATTMGASVVPVETGGYVLVGLLSFVAAVALTVSFHGRRARGDR